MNAFDRLLMGKAPEFLAINRAAALVAATHVPLLILGESGTGKELLARAVHAESPRAGKPFLSLNCAALPESLAESEMFGHSKGAFTGAEMDKIGKFRSADGGTLFLDEVGELPLSIQAKLLRFLESGEIQAVGEAQPGGADVRVIAATNSDLLEQVRTGQFREDLFYRLNVVPLELPPLRERTGEVEFLAPRFLAELAAKHQRPAPTLAETARRRLEAHPWPGNVRELKNLCERLVVLHPGETIRPDHLPREIGEPLPTTEPGSFTLPEAGLCLATVEKNLIHQALRKANGNKSRAARLLGLSRDTLLYRLKKYAVS